MSRHAAYRLEFALFRHQREQVQELLSSPSAAFQAYERRYQQRTRTVQKPLALEEIHSAVLAHDVVYVGDYHTLKSAQQAYVELAETTLRASTRPLVLALEFVEGRHQSSLDAYLAGTLDEDGLREALGHPLEGEKRLWAGFLPVLRFAKKKKLRVVGIDRRAPRKNSLQVRDAYAAKRIAQALAHASAPRVLVLVGQYHVVPEHLPACVTRELAAVKRTAKGLVVYQNCEGAYWSLARRGLQHSTAAARIRAGELCLFNASPVICQQSFLDYLAAEAHDAANDNDGTLQARFEKLAELLGGFVNVDVRDALEDTEILTSAAVGELKVLQRRGRLSHREFTHVQDHVRRRQSAYVPRARTAYLASTSIDHISEEACHFVRHCCIGDAMDEARKAEDAFYARCIEEALAFFGSRLVHPRRPCPTLDEWADAFQSSKRAEERHVAAFVLAHKAAESMGEDEARKLVPLRPGPLFNGVTHGLGYLLGDALHCAFLDGTIGLPRVRALFRDALATPAAQYFAMMQEFRVGASVDARS